MTIGVLIIGHNCSELIHGVLEPWLVRTDTIISGVHCQFKGYAELFGVEPVTVPDWAARCDHFSACSPRQDHEARNIALQPLLDSGCDLIWIVDSDEYYEPIQIGLILEHVERNPNDTVFKVHFKNYLFDGTKWEDFCPKRIYRVRPGGAKLGRFVWENDVVYDNPHQSIVFDAVEIPASIAHIKHYSWLNNEQSRKKILYYEHIRPGYSPFEWVDGQLKFSHSHYNGNFPQLYTD